MAVLKACVKARAALAALKAGFDSLKRRPLATRTAEDVCSILVTTSRR